MQPFSRTTYKSLISETENSTNCILQKNLKETDPSSLRQEISLSDANNYHILF